MNTVTTTLIQRPELALKQTPSFLSLVEMTKQVDMAWKAIAGAAIPAYEAGKIDKTLKGPWGSMTVGERKTWKIIHELPEEYYVKALDTKRLTRMYDDGEPFPSGVDFAVTPYLTKKLK